MKLIELLGKYFNQLKIYLLKLKNLLIPDIPLGELFHKSFQVVFVALVPVTIVIYFFTLPASTLIQAKLFTDRITFSINEGTLSKEKNIFLEPLAFKRIEIQTGFSEAKLYPQNGESLQITAGQSELLPVMQMEVANSSTLATLTQLELKQGSKVTLEYREEENQKKKLYLEVLNQKTIDQQSIKLSYGENALNVVVQYCLINGKFYPSEKKFIEKLSPRNRAVEVKWQGESCSLLLTVKPDEKFDLLSKPLNARRLEFLFEKLEGDGKRITRTTIDGGKICYPQVQKCVEIGTSNFLHFDEHDQFYLEKVIFNPELKGIELHLSGTAKGPLTIIPEGLAYSGSNTRHDYRLNYWEVWVDSSPFWKMFISVMIGLISTVLGLVAIMKVEIERRKP